MYVIGATHPETFAEIRALAKDFFFLVPGVGAQGGDMNAVFKNGKNDEVGLLVNSSRDIIYAGNGPDFQEEIRIKAQQMQKSMSDLMA